jgi:hypothetical protein
MIDTVVFVCYLALLCLVGGLTTAGKCKK